MILSHNKTETKTVCERIFNFLNKPTQITTIESQFLKKNAPVCFDVICMWDDSKERKKKKRKR